MPTIGPSMPTASPYYAPRPAAPSATATQAPAPVPVRAQMFGDIELGDFTFSRQTYAVPLGTVLGAVAGGAARGRSGGAVGALAGAGAAFLFCGIPTLLGWLKNKDKREVIDQMALPTAGATAGLLGAGLGFLVGGPLGATIGTLAGTILIGPILMAAWMFLMPSVGMGASGQPQPPA
jgi:hypothetical protein